MRGSASIDIAAAGANVKAACNEVITRSKSAPSRNEGLPPPKWSSATARPPSTPPTAAASAARHER